MISTTEILVGGAVLGIGTYAFRAVGPFMSSRVRPSQRMQSLMATAATCLLVALCVTSALADGQEWADPARPIGVLVGGVLAWVRAPFVVVVVSAAATAALLRLVI